MDYRDIQKLIAFFSALKDSGFKQDLKQIPSSVIIDGQRTPVDKSYCLSLLRRFPQFQGDKFKDDNALLKYLSDPNNRKFLLGNFTRTQQVELTKVLEEKPVVEETFGEQPGGQEASSRQTMGEPAGTMAGGIPFPATSSGVTAAHAPQRVIRVVRQTPEPETTTSTSSRANVKFTTATPPSAKSGSATITSSKGFTPAGSTSISSSTAFSSGGINIKIGGPPNVAKNFGSNAQIFAKKNLGRLGSSLGDIAKGVGRGIAGPGLTSLYKGLGKVGGGGLNAFERLNSPGLKGVSRSFASSGSKRLVWGLLLGLLFFVFFSGIIGGLSGTTPSGEAAPAPGFIGTLPPSNPDCPKLHDEIYNQFKVDFDQKNPFSCDYLQWAWEKLWNISNTKFLDLVRGPDKNKIITVTREDKGFNEQTGCPSIIMSGISSATGQPYLKSLFQVVFIHELSHIIENCNRSAANLSELSNILASEGGISTFSQNPTKCISGVTQLNEDFAETLAYYLNPKWGEQAYFSSCQPQLSTNPILRGDKPLHQQFAAELLGSSVPLSVALPQISCPVVGGGPNILPSYQADSVDGHCGTGYNQKLSNPQDRCQGNTRRGKSIDIDTCQIPRSWEQVPPDYSTCGPNGKDVELPTIDGQRVDWKYIGDIPLERKDCFDHEIVSGCGTGYIFKADLGGGKNWVLHLLHMGTTTIQPGEIKPSGTIVGKTEAIHTHISIGQDVPDSDIKDQVKSYWKSVDTELKLCQ